MAKVLFKSALQNGFQWKPKCISSTLKAGFDHSPTIGDVHRSQSARGENHEVSNIIDTCIVCYFLKLHEMLILNKYF